MIKEALFYEKLGNELVRCNICRHCCVIGKNRRGICGAKINKDGILYSLNYGRVISCNIDPIEKKPLFHFLPGTTTVSFASAGCNFICQNCQNWEISQSPKSEKNIPGKILPPEKIIEVALENNAPSISYTYTEPTVFIEYALDVMRLAKNQAIKNVWVSNGYLSEKSLKVISPFIDAANIDLKSFDDNFYRKYCGALIRPVLDNLVEIKNKKIWLEITTLIIPSLNDSEKILRQTAKFIRSNLGPETPWHISRFNKEISWKLKNIPDTPIETVKKAWEIGKEEGLKYVYSGNMPGHPTEDTYCPNCNARTIERTGYNIKRYDNNGRCQNCKKNLDLILN